MKVLLLDIETSPNLAYVWGIWEQNINLTNMVATSTVLCWSAKWLGEEHIMHDSLFESSPKQMLKGMHKLLDEADVVVHFNGKRFDIPTLNREFLMSGMRPPAPFKQIDILNVVRDKFRFLSNKLSFISKELKLGEKTKHNGIQLWVDCLAKKPEAWATMKKYNKQDVLLLERLYLKVLPWIEAHPNRAAFEGSPVCTNCGQEHYQKRGTWTSRTTTYQKYVCLDCGTWFKKMKNGKHTTIRP